MSLSLGLSSSAVPASNWYAAHPCSPWADTLVSTIGSVVFVAARKR